MHRGDQRITDLSLTTDSRSSPEPVATIVSHPTALATWTAAIPTPPVLPLMRTVSLGCRGTPEREREREREREGGREEERERERESGLGDARSKTQGN